MTRVVIISDTHCGHAVGLTPPQHQGVPAGMPKPRKNKLLEVQGACWNFFAREIEALRPIDVLILNGDAVDGRGVRSGGTEQITVDMNNQVEIAVDCTQFCKAGEVHMTYGTASHTGEEQDWEDSIAKQVKASSIGSHQWIDVHGLVFDCKHHLSSSGIPHGRTSAISRERLWNVLWTEHSEAPKGDIIIRSHVHYHNYAGGSNWLALSTPALQGLGTKYGARRCSGTVDYGLVHFDVSKDGSYEWAAHIGKIPEQRATVTKTLASASRK
jgi:3',5'-cyclic AMP phosphodiesterase CpdA